MSQPTLVGCLWNGPCTGYEMLIVVAFVLVAIIMCTALLFRRSRTGKNCVIPEHLFFVTRLFLFVLLFLGIGLKGILVWIVLSILFEFFLYFSGNKFPK